MLAYQLSTSNMTYHLIYVSISNFTRPLNLMLIQKYVSCSSVCAECGSWIVTHSLQDRWRRHLLICSSNSCSTIFAHTDKSNTSFESVKTLHLFVCTHNNNKTLCFCKIMKASRMCFLPSRSVNLSAELCVYLYLTDIKKYIYRVVLSRYQNFSIRYRYQWKSTVLGTKAKHKNMLIKKKHFLSLIIKPMPFFILIYNCV